MLPIQTFMTKDTYSYWNKEIRLHITMAKRPSPILYQEEITFDEELKLEVEEAGKMLYLELFMGQKYGH